MEDSVPPESAAELLAWQAGLEATLEARLESRFIAALSTIRTLALRRSLTQAAASQAWADAVDATLAEQRLPDDPAVGRLRDALLELHLGDQAYESVLTVDTLYRQQLVRPSDEEYVAALDEALGLESGTTSLTAAGAMELPGPTVLERVRGWMRARTEGLNWRAQIRRGVRSGFTGLTGSLVMTRLSLSGSRSKKWVTKHDDRVRATHAAADGQVVPLNAPFVVGGQLLRYPGDPIAAAGERINCRCVITSGDE